MNRPANMRIGDVEIATLNGMKGVHRCSVAVAENVPEEMMKYTRCGFTNPLFEVDGTGTYPEAVDGIGELGGVHGAFRWLGDESGADASTKYLSVSVKDVTVWTVSGSIDHLSWTIDVALPTSSNDGNLLWFALTTWYMNFVRRYFDVLLPLLAMLQFTKGGPIIAFQVENEYGSTTQKPQFLPDKNYLSQLRDTFLQHGIVELLVTSDSPTAYSDLGTIPKYFLQTANFATDPEAEFNMLKKLQTNRPTMAMEFWTGWFDHWTETHHLRPNSEFQDIFERILRYPASVNMYMFHGGTNFGFLNGANLADGGTDNKAYQPTTSSYDYDAPLAENGDYTEKYAIVKKLLAKYNEIELLIPQTPSLKPRKSYPTLSIHGQLNLNEIIEQSPHKFSDMNIMPMEFLPINNNSGQSYGYTIYRTTLKIIPPNAVLKITGRMRDSVSVLVNGKLVSKPLKKSADLNEFGYWRKENGTLQLPDTNFTNATLELLVENWGRVNFGKLPQFYQEKGLLHEQSVFLNNNPILEWEIIPLEFKKSWNKQLTGWHNPDNIKVAKPALYRSEFLVDGEPVDTYLDMSKWSRGLIIINGFVLGRYCKLGPQQALYLPAPFFKKGANQILIFELFNAADNISFSTEPIYKTN